VVDVKRRRRRTISRRYFLPESFFSLGIKQKARCAREAS
jgi:hypothetical protein